MPFISQVLNRPVVDQEGTRLGQVKDFLFAAEERYPPIQAVVVKAGRRFVAVPWQEVNSVTSRATVLRGNQAGNRFDSPSDDLSWLVRDVLDKQIVDTGGVRLVRVNDIALAPINDDLRVAGVDRSMLGILRQLMPGWSTLANKRGDIIDWEDLDLGPALDVLRLRTPFAKLARMRPADIAAVISQMSPGEAADVLEILDDETAAEALAEMGEEDQASVVIAMEPREAADILEEMAPDEAADVLGEIEEGRASELMQLMQPEAASEVRSLLAYGQESAGGLMTAEYLVAAPDETAAAVLQRLRADPPEDLETHAFHVLRPDGALQGWLSLWDVVLAAPDATIATLALKPDRAQVDEHWQDVARRMLHYRLLSIPVVDEEEHLVGVIGAGDIAQWLAPGSWLYRP